MQKSGLSMETHPHHIYIYVSLLLQFVPDLVLKQQNPAENQQGLRKDRDSNLQL